MAIPIPGQPVRQVTILGLPPATNHLYPSGRDGRRHLSAEGRAWGQMVADECMAARVPPFIGRTHLHLRVDIDFVGMTDRRDIDGGVKILLDALAEALGFDDRWIDELHVCRRRRADWGVTVPQTRVVIMEMSE